MNRANYRRGVGDFVRGGFPLPVSPIYDGMGDLVPGGFPLPQTPVYASASGSLPKSPDLTMRDLAPLPSADSPCAKTGIGCGCSDCGMGDDATTTAQPFYEPYLTNAETWFQGSTSIAGTSITNMYLAGAAVALFLFMNSSRGGGRARR